MFSTVRIFIVFSIVLVSISLCQAGPRFSITDGGGLLVDGEPLLPIMVWAQPRRAIELHKSLGVNTLHPGNREPIKPYLDELHGNGMYAMVNMEEFSEQVKGHPAVIAWTVEHEPDMPQRGENKGKPKRMPDIQKANYQKMKSLDPDALTWNINTVWFFGSTYQAPQPALYDEYLKWTDITSFDHYPVTGWDKPERLPEVGLATRKLVAMSRANLPVITIVEASDQQLSWTAPKTIGPTPQEMRAEIWMAIANGAKGIGYFTIAFGKKDNSGFKFNHLTDDIKAEMIKSNGELKALTGPIVLGEVSGALKVSNDETDAPNTDGHAIQAIRKDYQGKIYIIAVNVTRQVVTGKFTLDDLGAKTANVWRQRRSIDIDDNSFTDSFKPLEVHVYVLDKP